MRVWTVLLAMGLGATPTSVGGALAVDPLGRGTWVVDEDTDAVLLVPRVGTAKRFEVGRWPQQLVVDAKGRVFVSCRQDGWIARIDAHGIVRLTLGGEPTPLYLDEAAGTVYVGTAFGQQLIAVDTEQLTVERRRSVDFEPVAIARTASGLAVLGRKRSPLWIVSDDFDPRHDLRLSLLSADHGVRPGQGLGLVTVGDRLIALHTFVDSEIPDSGSSSVDLFERSERVATALTVFTGDHDLQTYSPLPVSGRATLGTMGDRIAVVGEGNGVVLLVRLEHGRLTQEAWYRGSPGLVGATAVDGAGLQTLSAFERSVDELKLLRHRSEPLRDCHSTEQGVWEADAPKPSSPLQRHALPENPALVRAARHRWPANGWSKALTEGRLAFHRVLSADDAQLSCASCHPDGREDGVAWMTPRGLRRTPVLSGLEWVDDRAFKHHIIRFIKTETPGWVDLEPLKRYLRQGLRPIPVPPLDLVELERGRQVFEQLCCSACHRVSGPGEARAIAEDLNPPRHLHGLAIAAPYFQDSRRRTLPDLLLDSQHASGIARGLSSEDNRALLSFLGSL